ncbi:MAG: ANTAR domain-containing protein [Clostridiales bacterium]|nr:ANTAR domain-containing protein [Clostridiales bacterium]
MERIVLAFSNDETARKIKHILDGSGYEVSYISHSRDELLRILANQDELLVIMGYKIGEFVADDIYEDLFPSQKLMSIVKAEKQSLIENEDIFVLPLPVNRQNLISSIEIFLGVVHKRSSTKRSGEDQKIIEKAKLYLMEKHCMTEEQAHRFIQKRSMDTGSKFIDMARMILHI